MVFGWGKKKEEKKEENHAKQEIPQNKEIQYADIPKIIADLKQLRESQTTSEIKHLRNSTAPLIEELIRIGNVLEKDSLKVDDIDRHLAIIVVRGKKQVISVIKKDVVPLPEVKTIGDASKLNSLLGQILKKVGDVLGRQTRVIHIFAKKYAEQLKNNLEVMNSNHAEIQKLLKNYQDGKDLSEQILKSVDEIDKIKKSKEHKIAKISETKNLLQKTNASVSLIENSVEKIKSSEHYKKYLELESSLDSLTNKKSQIKNSIYAQFTKISRPLSRYEYGSSLDKEQKNLLTQLVNDPFDILLPKNRDPIITILENVKKGIVSGSISVKDQDKSMQQITEVEESLDSLISRVLEHSEKLNSLQNELDSYDLTEFNNKKNDLEKNHSLQKALQLKLESFQEEVNECEAKIPAVICEVQTMMQNYSNTKYVVLDSKLN